MLYLELQRGNHQAAITEYREVLRLDPHYPGALRNLAVSLYETGLYEEARDILSDLASREPRSASVRHCFGLTLLKRGEAGLAPPELRSAVRLQPDNPEGHYALGQTLRRLGRDEEAAEAMHAAGRLRAGRTEKTREKFLEDHAQQLALAGHLDAAADKLRDALAVSGNDRIALNSSMLLVRKDDFDEAIDVLGELAHIGPEQASFRWRGFFGSAPLGQNPTTAPPRAGTRAARGTLMDKPNKDKPRRARRQRGRGEAVPTALPCIRPHAAGIDLGSCEHWVCAPPLADGKPNVRVFSMTTPQLARLADWLQEQGVETVAMESTHVYWIPVYELLESRGLEVLLANARQLRHVPGRKTDMIDCQWLQLLHGCGLLRGSFRPGESITRLRALHWQLGNLTRERTRCVQWMQQALDQMNVQVHRVVSDLTGQTGMAIVRAIAGGERDPLRLAALRGQRCHKSPEQFAAYLTGTWREEHLFNLESALQLYDAVQERIAAYEERLLEEIRALQPQERQEEPVPARAGPPQIPPRRRPCAAAATSRRARSCGASQGSI